MVLDHVAQRAGLLVIAAAALHTDRLGARDLDRAQTYSGVLLVHYLPANATTVPMVDARFQVNASHKTWTETSPGVYSVEATLEGKAVAVHAEVLLPGYAPGDRLMCNARLDVGSAPAVPGSTIFGADMTSGLQTP